MLSTGVSRFWSWAPVPHNSEKPGNQFKNSNHSKMADVLLGKGKLKP